MDAGLVAWARAAKARRARLRAATRGASPTLWLFSDAVRAPDVLAAAQRLPPGISGIVLRHGDVALALALAKQCRRRRVALVLAVPHALPGFLRAGRHLKSRGPYRGPRLPRGALLTAAAHDAAALIRARRLGADLVFLSPAFPTASHPSAPAWGPWRWSGLAGSTGAAALGGVTVVSIKRLGERVTAAGAITALL